MAIDQIVAEFSQNRLGGEPVPEDAKVLLVGLLSSYAIDTGMVAKWTPPIPSTRICATRHSAKRHSDDEVSSTHPTSNRPTGTALRGLERDRSAPCRNRPGTA